jgi:hypothetical protein
MQKYNLSSSSGSKLRSQKNSLYDEIMAEVHADLAEAQKIIEDERPFLEQPLDKSVTINLPNTPPSRSRRGVEKLEDKMSIAERSCSVERVQKTEKKMRKSFIIRKMGSSMGIKEGTKAKIVAARPLPIPMPMTTMTAQLVNLPFKLNAVSTVKVKCRQAIQETDIVQEAVPMKPEAYRTLSRDITTKDLATLGRRKSSTVFTNVHPITNEIKEKPQEAIIKHPTKFEHPENPSQIFVPFDELPNNQPVNSGDDIEESNASQLSFDIQRELEFTQQRLLEIKLQQDIENENGLMRHEVF